MLSDNAVLLTAPHPRTSFAAHAKPGLSEWQKNSLGVRRVGSQAAKKGGSQAAKKGGSQAAKKADSGAAKKAVNKSLSMLMDEGIAVEGDECMKQKEAGDEGAGDEAEEDVEIDELDYETDELPDSPIEFEREAKRIKKKAVVLQDPNGENVRGNSENVLGHEGTASVDLLI
jgi:hypothetical protein